MMEKMKKDGSGPSLSPACALIEQFGSRWALLVLLTLHDRGILRFSELVREIPGGVSERMLAATLHDLGEAGLVARRVYPEVPPRVEYALTPKARSLLPLLQQLIDWAEHNA